MFIIKTLFENMAVLSCTCLATPVEFQCTDRSHEMTSNTAYFTQILISFLTGFEFFVSP